MGEATAVNGWIGLADAAAELDSPRGLILNVGRGRQHSVREVVERIAQLCAYRGDLQWGALAPAQPETSCWVADLSLTRAALRWEPATDLESGLRETVDWLRGKLNYYDGAS